MTHFKTWGKGERCKRVGIRREIKLRINSARCKEENRIHTEAGRAQTAPLCFHHTGVTQHWSERAAGFTSGKLTTQNAAVLNYRAAVGGHSDKLRVIRTEQKYESIACQWTYGSISWSVSCFSSSTSSSSGSSSCFLLVLLRGFRAAAAPLTALYWIQASMSASLIGTPAF